MPDHRSIFFGTNINSHEAEDGRAALIDTLAQADAVMALLANAGNRLHQDIIANGIGAAQGLIRQAHAIASHVARNDGQATAAPVASLDTPCWSYGVMETFADNWAWSVTNPAGAHVQHGFEDSWDAADAAGIAARCAWETMTEGAQS